MVEAIVGQEVCYRLCKRGMRGQDIEPGIPNGGSLKVLVSSYVKEKALGALKSQGRVRKFVTKMDIDGSRNSDGTFLHAKQMWSSIW